MNATPLLLADPSPCLRWLALRDLFAVAPDDAELHELAPLRAGDPLVRGLLDLQAQDGSWLPAAFGGGWGAGNRILATALGLARLGYLGFDGRFPAAARAADFLFARQAADGSWPLPADQVEPEEILDERKNTRASSYTMIPLQTALPLRGLAACGLADDPRSERAYDWLLAQRLPDGAWPTGLAAGGVHGFVGGYRRLAHSRWGCRSNTTGALICLAFHPRRRTGPEARAALDLLLGRETRDEAALGFEVARLVGAEPARGFITSFARFDLGLLLDLCWRVGVSSSDPRLADLVRDVRALRGPYGMWSYPHRPQAARWVTFDLARSLRALDLGAGDWVGLEPRTPFQPYPRKPKRF
jgi:hypothetical protein